MIRTYESGDLCRPFVITKISTLFTIVLLRKHVGEYVDSRGEVRDVLKFPHPFIIQLLPSHVFIRCPHLMECLNILVIGGEYLSHRERKSKDSRQQVQNAFSHYQGIHINYDGRKNLGT